MKNSKMLYIGGAAVLVVVVLFFAMQSGILKLGIFASSPINVHGNIVTSLDGSSSNVQGVSGATIKVISDSGATEAVVTSDSSGSYIIPTINSNKVYTIKASAPGYLPRGEYYFSSTFSGGRIADIYLFKDLYVYPEIGAATFPLSFNDVNVVSKAVDYCQALIKQRYLECSSIDLSCSENNKRMEGYSTLSSDGQKKGMYIECIPTGTDAPSGAYYHCAFAMADGSDLDIGGGFAANRCIIK